MGQVFRVFMLLMGISFAVGIAVVASTRLAYPDPFNPYLAIMPGQSTDGLEDYPCQFRATLRNQIELGSCQFDAKYGIFTQVVLEVSNHIITRMTSFEIQPGALYLGNLILCWGNPIYVANNYPNQTLSLDLYWQNQMHAQVSPVRYTEKPDYSLSVTFLSIGGDWKPVASDLSTCLSA